MRIAAKAWMLDACIIKRDAQGVADGVLDPVTLALSRPGGDEATIYEGPCLVTVVALREVRRGDQTVLERSCIISLPHDAGIPRRGDALTITASQDPALVNQLASVDEVDAATMLALRRLTAIATSVVTP